MATKQTVVKFRPKPKRKNGRHRKYRGKGFKAYRGQGR